MLRRYQVTWFLWFFLCLGISADISKIGESTQHELIFFFFKNSFRIYWHILLKRCKISSVSEKHKLGDNETVCSCVTMWKLNRPVVAIIWHIIFWYRYHHLNVGILGPTFQLAFSDVFSKGYSSLKNDQRQIILHIYCR